MLVSSGSGVSDSDNLTNRANVIVSGGTAANAVVRVTRDGSPLEAAIASPGGVWAAPVPELTLDDDGAMESVPASRWPSHAGK